jgi:hypothetical protein
MTQLVACCLCLAKNSLLFFAFLGLVLLIFAAVDICDVIDEHDVFSPFRRLIVVDDVASLAIKSLTSSVVSLGDSGVVGVSQFSITNIGH